MSTYEAFEAALAKGDTSQLRLLYEVAIHQRNLAEDRVRCLLNTKVIGPDWTKAEIPVNVLAPKPMTYKDHPSLQKPKESPKVKPTSTEIEF